MTFGITQYFTQTLRKLGRTNRNNFRASKLRYKRFRLIALAITARLRRYREELAHRIATQTISMNKK